MQFENTSHSLFLWERIASTRNDMKIISVSIRGTGTSNKLESKRQVCIIPLIVYGGSPVGISEA